jgi:hypothetical protein
MNEILAYVAGYKRSADVCYLLHDGSKAKVCRKLSDVAAIKSAIEDLKSRGIQKIVIDVFRPNGTGKVFDRSFTIQNDVSKDPEQRPSTSYNNHQPIQQQKPMESWKDYALQTEREKVSKLETEVAKLRTENKSLDGKVRDFEKEMIRKEHDLENLNRTVESKSGLSGLIEKASENPAMLTMLSGLAGRLLGLPPEGSQALLGSPELMNAKTEQYINNVRAWLYKQPDAIQDNFYILLFEITNSKDVAITIQRLINLVKNGTTIPSQSKVAS